MAGFRDRRIMLLIFLALICVGLILGIGPQWGVDITGGSRIYLRLEASQVTLKFSNSPSDNDINDLIDELKEGLHASVKSLMSYEDVRAHNQIVLEIGKIVTENMVSPLIGGGVEIQPPIKNEVSPYTREEVIDALYTRVDPYGTLGAQFKSLEKNYVLFEVALPLERAEKLLSHRGSLEIFIENELVLRGEHLKDVGSPRYSRERMSYEVPFELTDEGVERFARASDNKGGYPGVIYLDRAEDSILLFEEGFIGRVTRDAEADPSIGAAAYDGVARRFRFRTLGDGEANWFTLQVDALEIGGDNIPAETLEYLRSQRGVRRRVVLLGNLTDLSENMIRGENLVWDNETLFPIEEEPQLGGEFTTEWLARVAGLKSWPIISEEIAGNENKIKTGLVITTGTKEDADDLYIILSQRLPVGISIESESEIEPRLGEEFLEEAAKAGLVAFLAVGTIVYLRYRRFKIVIPLMMTMACEVIIPLGVASAFHGFVTFGIAEIGALIVVVGTGVDHQIIISDEVLAGISPTGKLPIKRRVSRAFSIIFAAAATTIAAMVMLGFLGFGAMRGFAIIITLGVLISVLITRPAYARIIGILLERESREQRPL